MISFVHGLNLVITALFALGGAGMLFYAAVSFFRRPGPVPASEGKHRFAVLICARNEEAVIGELLESIQKQTYPADRLTAFVMADNSTDRTARIARERGAVCYTRTDPVHVGKGYALDALCRRVEEDYPGAFDGYFIFDADNVLAPDFVERMDAVFSSGKRIVTGYRNTKNFESSLSSKGQGVMFLTENRFLNYPRSLLGNGALVAGTGFLVDAGLIRENGGWPYHLLTEDVEFTAAQLLKGNHAYHCRDAEFFDEQPVQLRASWTQRTRWIQGYLQVFRKYGAQLIGTGLRTRDYSCFDLILCYFAPVLLMLAALLGNLAGGAAAAIQKGDALGALRQLLLPLLNGYGLMLCLGTATVVSEWKRIRTSVGHKLLAIAAFPVYMMDYVFIGCISLFKKRQWKEIRHSCSMNGKS